MKINSWKYFILLLQSYIMTTQALCLSESVEVKVFQSMEEYKSTSELMAGVSVKFNMSQIKKLQSRIFISKFSFNITEMYLNDTGITLINNGAFTFLTCLSNLDLSNNNISDLACNTFSGLVNLKSLNMSNNSLSTLRDNAFYNLQSLQFIDLSYNRISQMAKNALSDLFFLKRLILSHNSIKGIKEAYFDGLIYLEELNFDHNEVALFPIKVVKRNLFLEKLDLSGNSLVLLVMQNDDTVLDSIKFLNLSDNYIISLNVCEVRSHFPSQNLTIDLNDNQFYCSEWKKYLKEFREHNIIISPGRNFTRKYHINGMTCDTLNFTSNGDESEGKCVYFNDLLASLSKNKSRWKESMDNLLERISTDKLCDLMNNTHLMNLPMPHRQKSIDLNEGMSTTKQVVIGLSVTATVFLLLFILDYTLGIGLGTRLKSRFRHLPRSSRREESSDYVSLQSPT